MAPLTLDGQVEINGLLLGPGTTYMVMAEFNMWTRSVRFTEADRVWGPGAWSGREDTEAVAIPLPIVIDTADPAAWLDALHTLMAALSASSTDVLLRWRWSGTVYRMSVRPRLVDPNVTTAAYGWGPVTVALKALDPRVYKDSTSTVELGLPVTTGGLTLPFTVPFTIGATTVSGRATIINTGKATTGLRVRFNANGSALQEPRVTVISGGVTTVLRAGFTLAAGQWLTVHTEARTAYLNDAVSRRGYMSGDFPLLPPGVSEVSFDAGVYSSTASLLVSWEDAYA